MRAICPDENPPDSETPESTFSALAHESSVRRGTRLGTDERRSRSCCRVHRFPRGGRARRLRAFEGDQWHLVRRRISLEGLSARRIAELDAGNQPPRFDQMTAVCGRRSRLDARPPCQPRFASERRSRLL